jgi:hypothetical protein
VVLDFEVSLVLLSPKFQEYVTPVPLWRPVVRSTVELVWDNSGTLIVNGVIGRSTVMDKVGVFDDMILYTPGSW